MSVGEECWFSQQLLDDDFIFKQDGSLVLMMAGGKPVRAYRLRDAPTQEQRAWGAIRQLQYAVEIRLIDES